MNDVVRIEYRCGYVYWIEFDDGLSGEVDFLPFLFGDIFEPLKEVDFFRKAVVDGGTVFWPNGADVAPETLYERLEFSELKVAEGSSEYKTGNE
ncbi:MAG: DUF2442 domain-containing protein [Pontiellaceae bacterium]|nr:DUF2442 domain-containing protein [Pontiellaceae bacterium]